MLPKKTHTKKTVAVAAGQVNSPFGSQIRGGGAGSARNAHTTSVPAQDVGAGPLAPRPRDSGQGLS